MEIPKRCRQYFTDTITVIDHAWIDKIRKSNLDAYYKIASIIDAMGEGSRKAQNLSKVLTSLKILEYAVKQTLYVFSNEGLVKGILKMGYGKKLFIRRRNGNLNELDPLCCLDFYVNENCQRQGVGKQLFEFMRKREGHIHPARIALDRPSPKLLGFVAKHYKLKSFFPQSNNFVVFDAYFTSPSTLSPVPSKKKSKKASIKVEETTTRKRVSEPSSPKTRKISLQPANLHELPYDNDVPVSPNSRQTYQMGSSESVSTQENTYRLIRNPITNHVTRVPLVHYKTDPNELEAHMKRLRL
mmetsp:Transcript_7012/g.10298  ORF Transcript_7012/g.10298 Transcript_7012/m.10298 type:complete len:299 (+) Transcript_7012:27-923(+)